MGFANFFDKAALSAAQAVAGIDYVTLRRMLEESTIGVAFDHAAVGAPEGRCTLELTVNLLARLYPRIVLAPLGAASEDLTARLTDLARHINPDIEIGSDLSAATVITAVGSTFITAQAPLVYAGSTGWIARLSPEGPVGSGPTGNPFGAAAAACLAAANVFRLVFAKHLPAGAPDTPLVLSLLDYLPNVQTPVEMTPRQIDLGETFLVGLGAVGSATAWALARTPGLHGVLHLIDPETVDRSNLQRYLLTGQADVGAAKVELARATFEGEDLDVRVHQCTWDGYLSDRQDWNLDRVAVAVDNERDRLAVQAALPRWVVNAWTQPEDLGVSRHGFLDGNACLVCLYLPRGQRKHDDQLVAEAIGLPDAVREVRQLLATGAAVERELIERIAAGVAAPVEPLLAFEGRSLQTFYSEAICGGAVLRLSGQAQGVAAETAVPLAFQSALAGIMLAGELIAEAGQLREMPLPTTTRIDLLRPMALHLSVPAAKTTTQSCICQDDDYVARYREKYSQ